jgi:hypothetical protein
MEDALIIIIQVLAEIVLESLAWWPVDLPSRGRQRPEAPSIKGSCAIWFTVGALLGGLSVLLVKRTFLTHPALRLTNLLVAPLASAYLSEAIARHRQQANHHIIPRNHFWRAFWFTTGLVLLRFAYAVRS